MSAIKLGVLNFILYLLLVINYRSVAQGRYLESVCSDILIASFGFSLFKTMQEATTRIERLAYIIGGGIASAAGIYLTKTVFGE